MAPYNTASDAELIAACRDGDEAAWETLVQRYQRLVYAIPRRSGMAEEQAAEVFQRTFVRLVESLERISQPDRLSAWLITTAKRETWRLSQRERATITLSSLSEEDEEEFDLPDKESAPLDEDLVALERQHAIRTALASLDERCRTLLTLLYYRETPPSYADIARQLGTSEGSIGPTRARCLEKLRKLLDKATL